MKMKFLLGSTLFFSNLFYSQSVGINTKVPIVTLDVEGSPSDITKTDGFIAPRLTGDQLKAKKGNYNASHEGVILYITSPVTTPDASTSYVNNPGYYVFNGSLWTPLSHTSLTSDASRYIGGVVGVVYNSNTEGILGVSKLIGEALDTPYTIGTIPVTNMTSKIGGISFAEGGGYKVSNPAPGLFDIKLDTPFSEIYGVTVNIIDTYGPSVGNKQQPTTTTPGSALKTNDNAQISYFDKSTIRIKTGDSFGALSNRSFSFIILGK
ncbi:hypothetical protein [Chryseobacterium oryctis]|uniref:Uncharacterized protein n=1 Tax=Chryseobacterium oryctis TaxID=2952618 RepID=A0ABT3HNE2_9FLAO|nr:hypothetical protein [Chryseobacterium oryctis]MCW3161295.1 hypothetical protein [Chryseobacterium oryctis]